MMAQRCAAADSGVGSPSDDTFVSSVRVKHEIMPAIF